MKFHAMAFGAGLAALALVSAGTALARNPNCAGGIQYVVQGMRDKEKGNTEDYQREMMKAVDRLSQCATEDPEDLEALAYLGWAYAEVDSAGPAGQAFAKAIAGLKAKGDKKADWAASNRESYWAKNYNQGIADIQAGQTAYPDFTKAPADDGEKALKTEAESKYKDALTALTRASLLKPGDPLTIRNLGTVYALTGDLVKAESVLRNGLQAAPGDSNLISALALVRKNYAGKLIDEKRYADAIGFYSDLSKSTPSDPDVHLGLADAYFNWAMALKADNPKSDSAVVDFKSAGDEYARAAELKPNEPDLLFNAALSHQNANEYAQAEGEWEQYLKLKSDDVAALSAQASALVELKRYDEAITALHQAENLKPKDEKLHRQLGGVYSKAGLTDASTGEIMLYLALTNGAEAPDPADRARKAQAKSAAASVLASMGAPEEVRDWQGQGQTFETWVYWGKNVAFTFSGGVQVAKTDWGATPPRVEKAATTPAAKPAGKKK